MVEGQWGQCRVRGQGYRARISVSVSVRVRVRVKVRLRVRARVRARIGVSAVASVRRQGRWFGPGSQRVSVAPRTVAGSARRTGRRVARRGRGGAPVRWPTKTLLKRPPA